MTHPISNSSPLWDSLLDRLKQYVETEQGVQYDLYLEGEHIGGISSIGEAMAAWAVGRTFQYPYQGKKQEFVVERLTPEGGRMRADLRKSQINAGQ